MDEDIDQILKDIESPTEPMGMGDEGTKAAGAPETAAPAPSQATPEPAPWDPKPWEFDFNGRKVSPDSLEKARTWMSQGHNYSQRMAEINRRQKELDSLGERYKGYDRYSEIDAFARATPGWMDFVNQQFVQRGSWKPGQQPGEGAVSEAPEWQAALAPLQAELQELRQWREEQLAQAQQAEEQRHDEALKQEIESIRAANPNIDFDAVDESGRTLEGRIVLHAAEIGTTSYRAAFRDYLHDQLVESAKAAKLAAEAKAPAAAKASGILGTSPTPKKGPTAPVQTRGRSWDELRDLALSEHGIAQ